MFGRMGRALGGPLSDRQYSKGTANHFPQDDDSLRSYLGWWIGCLESSTLPRTLAFNPPRPALVYSDASGRDTWGP